MVRERYPDVVRMMLTGDPDIGVAEEAVNKGEIYKFITKPWNDGDLRATVRLGLSYYEMVKENKRLTELTKKQNLELMKLTRELEQKVAERTRALREALDKLNRNYLQTMLALAEAIELKDPYTRGHSNRVASYSTIVARRMGMDDGGRTGNGRLPKHHSPVHLFGDAGAVSRRRVDDGRGGQHARQDRRHPHRSHLYGKSPCRPHRSEPKGLL